MEIRPPTALEWNPSGRSGAKTDYTEILDKQRLENIHELSECTHNAAPAPGALSPTGHDPAAGHFALRLHAPLVGVERDSQ